MKKITKIFLVLALAIFGTTGLVTPSFADGGMDCNESLKSEIGETAYNAVCGNEGNSGSDGLSNSIGGILKAIIGITGIIAAIFVVIGAITYITAAGDPGKIKKGRDTIIYALIGLVLAALAFVITNAVIGAVNNNSSSEAIVILNKIC